MDIMKPNTKKLANGLPAPRQPERMPSPGLAQSVEMSVNERNTSVIPSQNEALHVPIAPSMQKYEESSQGDYRETSNEMQGMKGVQGPRMGTMGGK
jgi:hypothetical protein